MMTLTIAEIETRQAAGEQFTVGDHHIMTVGLVRRDGIDYQTTIKNASGDVVAEVKGPATMVLNVTPRPTAYNRGFAHGYHAPTHPTVPAEYNSGDALDAYYLGFEAGKASRYAAPWTNPCLGPSHFAAR